MARKKKSAPVFWLRSKLGRPFWRFGVHLSADSYSRFEIIPGDDPRAKLPCSQRKGYVTEAEVRAIEKQVGPMKDGGVLDMTAREPEPEKLEQEPENPEPPADKGDEDKADA